MLIFNLSKYRINLFQNNFIFIIYITDFKKGDMFGMVVFIFLIHIFLCFSKLKVLSVI